MVKYLFNRLQGEGQGRSRETGQKLEVVWTSMMAKKVVRSETLHIFARRNKEIVLNPH